MCHYNRDIAVSTLRAALASRRESVRNKLAPAPPLTLLRAGRAPSAPPPARTAPGAPRWAANPPQVPVPGHFLTKIRDKPPGKGWKGAGNPPRAELVHSSPPRYRRDGIARPAPPGRRGHAPSRLLLGAMAAMRSLLSTGVIAARRKWRCVPGSARRRTRKRHGMRWRHHPQAARAGQGAPQSREGPKGAL